MHFPTFHDSGHPRSQVTIDATLACHAHGDVLSKPQRGAAAFAAKARAAAAMTEDSKLLMDVTWRRLNQNRNQTPLQILRGHSSDGPCTSSSSSNGGGPEVFDLTAAEGTRRGLDRAGDARPPERDR